MTRRIAIAILLSVWVMLIIGGLLAYYTTRSILLTDLDSNITNRALTKAAQIQQSATQPATILLSHDRSVSKNPIKQTFSRTNFDTGEHPEFEPQIISAKFSDLADHRVRAVTIKYFAIASASSATDPNPIDSTEPPAISSSDAVPKPYTITYSQSAAQFDSLLNRLSWSLSMFGLLAGLIAAAVAVAVSRSALKPLARTAQLVGSINEQKLDRRIDATALPIELHPMASRLNEMLARLESAFALRNRFLADASHELRTPVASLVMALDIALSRPREAASYQRTLEICKADATQLRHLVDRLMEQVRSENLNHDETIIVTDVSIIVQQCLTAVQGLLESKNIRVLNHTPDKLQAKIAPHRLQSILMNLIGNAIEYNHPNGTIELSAKLAVDQLILKVSDTGVGIKPEDLPHVFEAFFRADPSRKQDDGHLGLGLSMVQAHAKAMNGECKVESEFGKGTMFAIAIPQ